MIFLPLWSKRELTDNSLHFQSMTEPPPCFADFCKLTVVALSWPAPYILMRILTENIRFGFIRPLAMDVQSSSCVIWQMSVFYPCFLPLGMVYWQPPSTETILRLRWTLDGSSDNLDAFLKSCVRSWISFLFVKDTTCRYCLSGVDSIYRSGSSSKDTSFLLCLDKTQVHPLR